MVKKIVLIVVYATSFSCRPPESTPDVPCFRCQLSETYQGVTTSSYWYRCGAASATKFMQDNTYQQTIMQHDVPYILSRVTTCVPK